jgi:uncharacterized protein (DUF1330 family)
VVPSTGTGTGTETRGAAVGHIEPSTQAIRALRERAIDGPVEMLNLLRFRETADYAASPELAPTRPITGKQAYDRYSEHTMPRLAEVGAQVVNLGFGGAALIGPADERWDLVLTVRYPSVDAFLGMTSNPDYLATVGHRTAALEDSRLVPMAPVDRG